MLLVQCQRQLVEWLGSGWQQGETEAHPGVHRKEEQVARQHGLPAGASLRGRTLKQLCPGLLFAVSWS